MENPGQEWDHEIEWDKAGILSFDDATDAAEYVCDNLSEPVTRSGDGWQQVWAVRPQGEACWLISLAGPSADTLGDTLGDDADEGVEIQEGFAAPGALERMAEFDGW